MRKYYLKFPAVLLFVLLINSVIAQVPYHLIPMPAEIKIVPGNFLLNNKTIILAYNKYQEQYAAMLNSALEKSYGIILPVKKTVEKGQNYVSFSSVHKESSYPAEGYGLRIENNSIDISSKTAIGTFFGIQTFMQILTEAQLKSAPQDFQFSISNLSITDKPQFAYRGMHLDVSRHFFPVSFVKKYIDYLAAYKFNTFHWHLTDDQGWRIEIKKYPKLTAAGGFRNGTIIGRYPGTGNDSIYYGGFYTQEEIKEVVRYAASKYITVIPEIEMPGHASAAIAAYPELSCFPGEDTKVLASTPWAGSRKGKQVQQTWGIFEDVFCPSDYTFNFLENVLDEVMALFPSKYIHIGGDECPKVAWKRSSFCQKLIKDKKLKDEHGLQSYFIQRMEKYLNSKGRKIIGWDEILEGGLAPNATVMSWRGEAGGIAAAKEKHDVIMTPSGWMYFDHTQSKNEDSVTIGGYTPLEKVYNYSPVPASLSASEAPYILGAQANLWTEYIGNSSKVEYMLFPRMQALAEVLWSPKKQQNWDRFEAGIPSLLKSLNQQNINYSTAYYEMTDSLYYANGKIGWSLKTKSPYQIKTTKDLKSEGQTLSDKGLIAMLDTYKKPLEFYNSSKGVAFLWDSANNKILSKIERNFSFNKATAKKITLANPPSKGYPGNGALTLVDGIQNEKALVRSVEFLGFNNTDLEAIIDLGKTENISEIKLHAFEQTGSWIYRPDKVFFYTSDDGKNFVLQDNVLNKEEKRNLIYTSRKNVKARFIKLVAKNKGIIPTGLPGAGNPAWLFADEIEIL